MWNWYELNKDHFSSLIEPFPKIVLNIDKLDGTCAKNNQCAMDNTVVCRDVWKGFHYCQVIYKNC